MASNPPDASAVLPAWKKLRLYLGLVAVVFVAFLYWKFRLSSTEWHSAIAEDFGSALLAWLMVTVTFYMRLPEALGFRLPEPHPQEGEPSTPAPGIQPSKPATHAQEGPQPSETFPTRTHAPPPAVDVTQETDLDGYSKLILNLITDQINRDVVEKDISTQSSLFGLIESLTEGILDACLVAMGQRFGLAEFPRRDAEVLIGRVSIARQIAPLAILNEIVTRGWISEKSSGAFQISRLGYDHIESISK